jgi:hypothetical protein
MKDLVKGPGGHSLKVADLGSDNYLTGDAVAAYCMLIRTDTQPGLETSAAKSSPADASVLSSGLAEVHALLFEMAVMMRRMDSAMACCLEKASANGRGCPGLRVLRRRRAICSRVLAQRTGVDDVADRGANDLQRIANGS